MGDLRSDERGRGRINIVERKVTIYLSMESPKTAYCAGRVEGQSIGVPDWYSCGVETSKLPTGGVWWKPSERGSQTHNEVFVHACPARHGR